MSNNKKDSNGKKALRSAGSMFKRLFVRDKTSADILAEEAIQTPFVTTMKNFFRNKLAIVGVVGFIAVFCFSFVGSYFFPIKDSYIELTNANIRPGMNYLNYPKELKSKNVVKIVSGISFSAAITDDGKFYIWGTESNKVQENVSTYIFDVPQEVTGSKIVDIAAGGNHLLAIDDQDNLYGWGYYGNNQTIMPDDVAKAFSSPNVKVKKMVASTQWTALLGSDGKLYVWGSTQAKTNFMIPPSLNGQIEDIVAGDNNMVLLLKGGKIKIIGDRGTEFYTKAPKELIDGKVKIKQIAATNRNVLAIDESGKPHLWGSSDDGLLNMPDINEPIKYIDSGYKNFVAVLESGNTVVWGANELKQLDIPKDISNMDKVFADYFQFYGIDSEGDIHSWGNKGYPLGSDQYGRDMLTRLIHGGRISLTVGAIAVLISTTIAIFVGLTAGFFGGWVDQVLMRLTDVFSSIPFYPIAITLSYVIGSTLNPQQRMYLIMVILGLLSWMSLARLIRAQLLLEREKDFVLAARALGIKQGAIMGRHILPNVFNLVIVDITLGYASSLLSEAGLSFLGFGVSEPTPSWGNMLTTAQEMPVIQFYWWRWVIPALFVVAAALCVNLIGDALREAMDPKANEK